MSINPFKKKTINIFIEDDTIRFLELQQIDPLRVKKFGERKFPLGTIREGKIIDKDAFLHTVSSLVEELKLKNRSIQFIVPDSLVVIRKMEVPSTLQINEIQSYLSLEIGTSIHLPFDNPVFDIHFIRETEETKEILLFAAPKDTILEYVEQMKEAKLKPIVADVSSLAFYRLYYKFKEIDPDQHILFVQKGDKSVNATIFHNHQPMFMRHIVLDSSEEDGAELISDNQIDRRVQELSAELERIINFYRFTINQGSELISKIVLIGVDLENRRTLMQEALDLPVEVFESEGIQLHPNKNESNEKFLSPAYYITLGLALKEVK